MDTRDEPDITSNGHESKENKDNDESCIIVENNNITTIDLLDDTILEESNKPDFASAEIITETSNGLITSIGEFQILDEVADEEESVPGSQEEVRRISCDAASNANQSLVS